jgi:hypothetical protein
MYEEDIKIVANSVARNAEDLTLVQQPLKTLYYFFWMVWEYIVSVGEYLIHHRWTIVCGIVAALGFLYVHEFGSEWQKEVGFCFDLRILKCLIYL